MLNYLIVVGKNDTFKLQRCILRVSLGHKQHIIEFIHTSNGSPILNLDTGSLYSFLFEFFICNTFSGKSLTIHLVNLINGKKRKRICFTDHLFQSK